jgi:hypothetical protein
VALEDGDLLLGEVVLRPHLVDERIDNRNLVASRCEEVHDALLEVGLGMPDAVDVFEGAEQLAAP